MHSSPGKIRSREPMPARKEQRATEVADDGGRVERPLRSEAVGAWREPLGATLSRGRITRRWIEWLACVPVLLLLASGCAGSGGATRDLKYGIQLSAAQLPAKSITVRRVKLASSPLRHATRLTPTFRLTHIAHLPSVTTIRFPLRHRVPRGSVLVALTRETGGGRWIPLQAQASPDGRSVTVRVRHFSDFGFFGIDVSAALRWVKHNLVDGILGGATANASPPQCAAQSTARSGYSIQSDSSNTVYWCFGFEQGHRVLKVVNNRRYTLDLAHPGLTVSSPGSFHLDLAALARLGSGNKTVLASGDEAIFRSDLAPGKAAGLSSDYDGLAQSLYQLQFGVEAAVSLMTFLGKSGITTVDTMGTLLNASGCASAIRSNVGDIYSKCLSPPNLIKAFGFKGLLAAGVLTAGPFVNFFRSELNSLGDQLNGRSRYRLVIRNMSATQTTTTTEPTTTAPSTTTSQQAGDYSIGAAFDDECVVAWPTAPTVTSSSIEMTMTCAHVPEGQFLFTYVGYGNPNLTVTPDTGKMHVIGKVVDIAKSDYGYKELVVQASSITFG